MFITHPIWKLEGVPSALLAPAIPWQSALLDVSEPCFLVVPLLSAGVPRTHVRLFSDLDQLLEYSREESDDTYRVYAMSRLDDNLIVSAVTAIGTYSCPQTSIKLWAYFDGSGIPRPAHSGQPQFSKDFAFAIAATFS